MARGRPAGWHALPHVSRLFLAGGLALLASSCNGRPAPRPALHRVVIRSFVFEPATLAVAAGDTVEWFNEDLVPHTASATSGGWDSQQILPGGSWRTVAAAPGSEPYVCRLHPGMKARLEVR